MSRKRFVFHTLGIFNRITKSILFNIFVLAIGFILGFGTMYQLNHIAWLKNPNYECVSRLEHHLKSQRVMDEEIDKEIMEFKMRTLHEKFHEGGF